MGDAVDDLSEHITGLYISGIERAGGGVTISLSNGEALVLVPDKKYSAMMVWNVTEEPGTLQ